MSDSMVKVFINGSWVDLVGNKVYSNGSWIDLTCDTCLYVKSKVSSEVIRYPLATPPLTLTANTDSSSVTLNKEGDVDTTGVLYRTSTDLQWRSYTIGTEIVLSNEGDYAQFKNSNTELSDSSTDYVYFSMIGSIAASGNIQSMLNYSDACSRYCYYNMFQDCTSLTTPPELPAETLASGCYHGMFHSCTSLTTAPELPAETLATNCYYGMFRGCTSLTTAPALPAETLVDDCYAHMFHSCTSLTTAPELPAKTLSNGCYMLMFYKCKALTQAPELPAETLATNCYYGMFNWAEKLTSVTVKFTTWLDGATYDWLGWTANTGTFTKPAALPEITGDDNIPEGWTIVNT